ncbi:MAG: FGGY family carbohydrate kinase [Sphaerochaetaceae bacterium]
MAIIATFDLGTTAIKCVVLDENQKQIFSGKEELSTANSGLFIEQDPEEWWAKFIALTKRFDAPMVDYLIFSGQMQDLILLDKGGNLLRPAILYNDQRAGDFVTQISKSISERTSISMNGSIPLAKLLWLKKNEPKAYARTAHILISAKDYLLFRLTGVFASDVTSMATSGMMDILSKKYVPGLDELINPIILPDIHYADEQIGKVTALASKETGFSQRTDVFAGSGDAGATTLASGIVNLGELNINLGTSGWIATISDSVFPGVFNLAAINRDRFINVIPILNAASVHKWLANMLYPDEKSKYDLLHELLSKDEHLSQDLLCLPYLVGERFPVSDSKIRGAYVGLDSKTAKADLARSALEGVAFSLRKGLEHLNIQAKVISLIGGGAAEPVWCQIFSDVFNSRVVVYGNSDVLPSMALASVVLVKTGRIASYSEFITSILSRQPNEQYTPNPASVAHYNALYQRFLPLYPTISKLD